MLDESELPQKNGAQNRIRTGDLVLTKDVLCQLSYLGLFERVKKQKKGFDRVPHIFLRQLQSLTFFR